MCHTKRIYRLAICSLCILMLTSVWDGHVFAELPYDSYNYDYWQNAVPTPAPYAPVETLSGEALGVGKFSNPSDMVIANNGDIYLCDSGNNRIIIFDSRFQHKRTISEFLNQGTKDSFLAPYGICLSETQDLYVADTNNMRIVHLSDKEELVNIIEAPVDDTLPDNFVFNPLKIGVDGAGRVYAIVKNVFEGMLNFDQNGVYSGYFGTNRVAITFADKFWRIFSTKEQRSKSKLFVPTEFTNLDIDDDGFVYTTDVDKESTKSIKKFNPSSRDVLKNFNVTAKDSETKKDLIGDYQFPKQGIHMGRSTLIDIDYREKGIYSVLDSARGRVITYDEEGNILYIFGGIGTQLGLFKKPVSIEASENSFYVLDQGRDAIIAFKATAYGAMFNSAIGLRYDGDEGLAVEVWKDVLKIDANCRLANIGIGKALLTENKNAEAMVYLQKGMDKLNYSVAFKRYRTDVLKSYFPLIVVVVVLIIALIMTLKHYKKRRVDKHGKD